MGRKKRQPRVEIDGVLYLPAGSDPGQVKTAGIRASRRAAAAALRMLWIYPNYQVGSRGPVGCIHDILRALAPGAKAMLEAGDDPHDVLRACFPEELE